MGPHSDVGPFSMVPRWVWTACASKPNALVLYACLADKADRSVDNGWTIGRMELAQECGMSESTLDRMVKHLIGIGALEVIRERRNGSWVWSRYLIRMARGVASSVTPVASPVNPGGVTSDDIPIEPIIKTARDEEFEDFWSKYPQKPGASKSRTRIAWNRAKADHTVMMMALTAWVWFWERECERKHWARSDEYVPLPTTWLNQRRWENPPKVPPKRKYRDKNEEFLASQQWRVIHGGG